MATKDNYLSSGRGWAWTGIRNLNQVWSYFYVDEPIIVTHIDVYWGGYDRRTSGRHFIARWTAGNGADLNGIIALSDSISVPQGRAWRSARIKETLLEPGGYAVGIFGAYLDRRTFGMWEGDRGGATYLKTTNNIDGQAVGVPWTGGYRGNVIPSRLQYEPAGRANIKVGNTWRKGQAHVKANGAWRNAKAVWVKSNGIWRRSR